MRGIPTVVKPTQTTLFQVAKSLRIEIFRNAVDNFCTAQGRAAQKDGRIAVFGIGGGDHVAVEIGGRARIVGCQLDFRKKRHPCVLKS